MACARSIRAFDVPCDAVLRIDADLLSARELGRALRGDRNRDGAELLARRRDLQQVFRTRVVKDWRREVDRVVCELLARLDGLDRAKSHLIDASAALLCHRLRRLGICTARVVQLMRRAEGRPVR